MILSSKRATGGFTTFEAQGHGFDFSQASTSERVRGRVERGFLVAVMPRGIASQLLEDIRKTWPVLHMTYWLEPVLEIGRLVEGSAPQIDHAGESQ
jgi:hypothetical protein